MRVKLTSVTNIMINEGQPLISYNYECNKDKKYTCPRGKNDCFSFGMRMMFKLEPKNMVAIRFSIQ